MALTEIQPIEMAFSKAEFTKKKQQKQTIR